MHSIHVHLDNFVCWYMHVNVHVHAVYIYVHVHVHTFICWYINVHTVYIHVHVHAPSGHTHLWNQSVYTATRITIHNTAPPSCALTNGDQKRRAFLARRQPPLTGLLHMYTPHPTWRPQLHKRTVGTRRSVCSQPQLQVL